MGRPVRPTVVFLDWGGTLAREVGVFREPWRIWHRVLAEEGRPEDPDRIRSAIDSTDREWFGEIYDYLGRTEEFWLRYDGHILDRLGIGSGRKQIVESVQRVFDDRDVVELYPETRPVLLALRDRGYRTGIISNHNDGLLRDLEHHELRTLFETVTYSQEARAEKPDPAVFSLALRRAGCSAAEAVYVGNTVEQDIEGARGVGIRPIWINRTGRGDPPGCPMIRSLDELLPLLDGLE